jgi:hypothetical protein
MSEETAKPLSVSLKPAIIDAVDDYRRRQPDLPNRSKAIGRLLTQVLSPREAGLSSRDLRHV